MNELGLDIAATKHLNLIGSLSLIPKMNYVCPINSSHMIIHTCKTVLKYSYGGFCTILIQLSCKNVRDQCTVV